MIATDIHDCHVDEADVDLIAPRDDQRRHRDERHGLADDDVRKHPPFRPPRTKHDEGEAQAEGNAEHEADECRAEREERTVQDEPPQHRCRRWRAGVRRTER